MQKDLFFSYGRDEYVEYVLKVKEYLEDNGFTVFFDKEHLKVGKNWEQKLEDGIEKNDKFLFFVTPHSRRHDGFCRNEIAMAIECDKEIIPIIIKSAKIPLRINTLQYIDLLFLCQRDSINSDDIFEERMRDLIDTLEGKKKLVFRGEKEVVFKKLTPIDFTQDFKNHKRFVGRKWVKDEVDKWIKEYKNSRVLWITADAGYGKSAIACHLSDVHPDVIGIHFCSYNYPSKNDPKNVIKTLAYHFQTQIDGYADEIVDVDKNEGKLYELFDSLILKPLERLQPKANRTYIVILDALDEALQGGDKKLAKLIKDKFTNLPNYVKIIITSRPEPQLKQILSGLKPLALKVGEEQNKSDCKEFIEVKLFELGHEEHIKEKEFIKILLERSEANMLYLTLFFDGVENRLIDIDKPDIFPIGLNGIYENFFSRITEDEDEYDETIAPLLEIITAYDEPIDKRLLADIVGLPFKKVGRILTKLGSMIRENNKEVDFYHKSLKDWLTMDENVSYFIDIKEGEKRFENFLDSLTPKTYKEEYLELTEFNKKLVDFIYNRDENLANFFELLSICKDVNKKVVKLNSLWWHYDLHNKMYRAILLQEGAYKILKPLYEQYKEEWAENYTTSLNNLASSYTNNNRAKDAIELEEEGLEIRKKLYNKNPERWAELYTISLNNLAFSYADNNRAKDAIELEEESLEILKKLYNKNPERWAELYTTSLNNLATSYKNNNRAEDAIELEEESLEILKKLYNKNPERWAEDYTTSLNNLATSYKNNNRAEDAIELEEEGLEIRKKLYNKNPERWAEKYTTSLNNLAFSYADNNRAEDAIELEEESLEILKKLYNKNPERWAELYTTSLNNLATSYMQKQRFDEALDLLKKKYEVVLKRYGEGDDRVEKVKKEIEYVTGMNSEK